MAPGSSWIILLVAEVVVSAGFVLGVTAAVERLGPRVGALIAATPEHLAFLIAVSRLRGARRRRSA